MAKVLEHKQLIIRAEVSNPPKCTDFMDDWMKGLVNKIGMKILDGPRTIYSDMEGNRGLTSSVILNTSNACIHTWDEVDPGILMLDIYSCGHLDPTLVLPELDVFAPTKVEYMFLDREIGLNLLSHKKS